MEGQRTQAGGEPDYTKRSRHFAEIQRKTAKICAHAGELANGVA